MTEITDRFSLSFHGPSTDSHTMSAARLAKTMLALDALISKSVESCDGKEPELKVSGELRAGSVIADFIVTYKAVLGAVAPGISCVHELMELVKMAVWLKGSLPEKTVPAEESGKTVVYGINGGSHVFNNCTIAVYCQPKTRDELQSLTEPLDDPGVTSIKIIDSEHDALEITSCDREVLKPSKTAVTEGTFRQVEGQFMIAYLKWARSDLLKISAVAKDGQSKLTLDAPWVPKGDLFFGADDDAGLKDSEIESLLQAFKRRAYIQLTVKMEFDPSGQPLRGLIISVD